MAGMTEFYLETANLGIDSDCPLCGYSWPGCQGMCVAHEAANGAPGPFHFDYNDDCKHCGAEVSP